MKPMLAATIEDIYTLTYPLYASPKLDGIRCLIIDNQPVSRKLKPIPNHYVNATLRSHRVELNNLDGELLVGNTFQDTTSGVMSHQGKPNFTYALFDRIDNGSFFDRFLKQDKPNLPFINIVQQVHITSPIELEDYESFCLESGYEGVMVRRADGMDVYKFGRSTLNQAYLLKLKRFKDAEATVIGFEEQLHNSNTLESDNLGYAKRSTKQEGMLPKNTLGSLVVISKEFGRFNVGTGFTDALRKQIWEHRNTFIGATIKFKYQVIGVKDKPRIPVFLGFRDVRDMSND